MFRTCNPLALEIYSPGWVFVVITNTEVVYDRVTDTVLGSGVGSVLTISFVVVYSVVLVSVTGTVITLDCVVMVLYVTGCLVSKSSKERNTHTHLDISSW